MQRKEGKMWRKLQQIIAVTLVLLFVAGCGAYTAKPTSIPSTPLPVWTPPTPSPSPEERMMDERLKERVMVWKGEKVNLLAGGEDGFIGISPSVTLKNEKLWTYRDPKQGLPAEKYAGQTGIITDIEFDQGMRLTIGQLPLE
jgi:hypothetical protein